MTDRPILFSAPMVRALLAGRKTQTRRALTAGNAEFGSAPRDFWQHGNFAAAYVDGKPESGQYLHVPCHRDHLEVAPPCDCERCLEMGWEGTVHRLWPRVHVGERLWVKETWRASDHRDGIRPSAMKPPIGMVYLADEEKVVGAGRTRVSIHMPKWASRLTLTITKVRIQRLGDISRDDALAEGIVEDDGDTPDIFYLPNSHTISGVNAPAGRLPIGQHDDPRKVYRDLVNNLHGGDLWSTNPWVVAIGFTVDKINIAWAKP